MMMKKIYTLCALLLAAFSVSAQCPVIDGSFTFDTQESIDNFTTNYPGCTSLGSGADVIDIGGPMPSDITNLDGLAGVTSYSNLWIWNTNLTTLEGLPASATFGTLLVFNNPELTTCNVPAVCAAFRDGLLVVFTDNQGECNFDDVFASCDPLPVTLVNFKVRRELQTSVLTWATTSETNSNRFEIERSKAGKSWNLIGSVKAQNESNFTKQYSFVDTKPLGGNNLYRLKMIDNDNTFSYSTIRSLDAGFSEKASIFPNPVNDQFQIQGTEPASTSRLKIYNMSGAVVYESSKSLVSNIDVKHLPAGMYVLQIIGNNGLNRTVKFAKK